MSRAGDIRLGNAGDLRDYRLIDPRQFHAEGANPLAPRLNTGGTYAELSGWAEWVQSDFQGGVGRTKPDEGGFLFADADTRVPNQFILPPALGGSTMWPQASTSGAGFNLPLGATGYGTLTLDATKTDQALAIKLVIPPTAPASITVSLLVQYTNCTSLDLWLLPDSAGAPNWASPTGLAQPTIEAAPYPQWVSETFTATFSAGATYWLVVSPDGDTSGATLNIPYTTTSTGNATQLWTSPAWYDDIGYYPVYASTLWASYTAADGFFSFTRSPQRMTGLVESDAASHIVYNTAYDAVNNVWSTPTSATTLTDNETVLTGDTLSINNALVIPGTYILEVQGAGTVVIANAAPTLTVTNDDTFVASPGALFDGYIYVALGDSYIAMEASTGGGTPEATPATSFTSWRGYLWLGSDANVYYSNDGTTWSDAIKVGSDDYLVRGLAGMETGTYCATDEGLFLIGDGSLVLGITPWSTRATDEVRMVNHQGALCIPIAGRIIRFTSDGSLTDIWIAGREADLPTRLLGAPRIMAGMNHWLLAAIDAGDNDSSSVWAWQTEGWHHIVTLPPGYRPTALYYDRELSRLWIGTTGSYAFYAGVDDNAINPYQAAASRFAPYGWLETPKSFGSLIRLDKDHESIFITGDFPDGTSCSVYYQSDQDTSWQLLGTVTEDGTELFWSDPSTRPTGKWIRLGYLLQTNDPTLTPRVTAATVKYMPMVTDKKRFLIPVVLADGLEMRDGTVIAYTVEEQYAHINSLIRQVAPCVFEDMAGTQYRVKIESFSEQITDYDQDLTEDRRLAYVFTLSLREL